MAVLVPSADEMARYRPVWERRAREGARMHYGKPGTQERRVGTGYIRQDECGGTLRVLYAREGTPARWTKAGTVCIACGAWWPEEGYPPRP